MKTCSVLAALVLLAFGAPSHALELITAKEAKLPAATVGDDATELPNATGLKFRGISRAPGIKLVSPDAAQGAIKAPFRLKIAFEPHGGSKIDLASVKVKYVKATPVDLLQRVRPGLTAAGIELADVAAPAGDHLIQVSLQDSEGRESSTIINLKVAN